MGGSIELKDGVSDAPDIEWYMASVDTALYTLVDRLRREKRTVTSWERRQFSADSRPHRAKDPRLP